MQSKPGRIEQEIVFKSYFKIKGIGFKPDGKGEGVEFETTELPWNWDMALVDYDYDVEYEFDECDEDDIRDLNDGIFSKHILQQIIRDIEIAEASLLNVPPCDVIQFRLEKEEEHWCQCFPQIVGIRMESDKEFAKRTAQEKAEKEKRAQQAKIRREQKKKENAKRELEKIKERLTPEEIQKILRNSTEMR